MTTTATKPAGATYCRCGSFCLLAPGGDGTLHLMQTVHGTAQPTGHRHVCVPQGKTVVIDGRILVGTTSGTLDVSPKR